MGKCDIWSDLIRGLQTQLGERRARRLLSLMRRDGILTLMEDISRKACLLRKMARFSREAGIGDGERAEKLERWSEDVMKYLRAVIIDLSRDKSYTRLILRRRDRALKYGQKLSEVLKQLDVLEERIVRKTKEDLKKKIRAIAGPRAGEMIRELDTSDPEALVDLLEDIAGMIGAGSPGGGTLKPGPLARVPLPGGDGGTAEAYPAGISEDLAGLREELLSKGVRFLCLESLHSALETLPEEVIERGRPQLMEFSNRVRFYGRVLLELSDEYLRLRGEVEEVRGDLANSLRGAGLEELSGLIELIGVPTFGLPVTVFNRADIQSMAVEVQRMRSLADGLREVLMEVEAANGNLRAGRGFSPYTMDEALLVRSIANFLRAQRLQLTAEDGYGISGIIDELVNLYSVWRSQIINLLRRKKQVRLEEIGYIPSRWKRWVLENLEREGVIRVDGGVISLTVPPSPLFRRVKLKLEFLGSLLEELEGMPGVTRADVDIPSIRAEFERLRRRWDEGPDERELPALDAELGELIRRLSYGKPFVESA